VQIIKLALISFGFFFLLLTAISLLVPSHVRISKAINIGADKTSIFSQIRDTAQWSSWHPGFKQTPQQLLPQKPVVTTTVQNDSLIIMNLNSGDKKTMVNGWQLYNYASTDSLTLQWYMDFHLEWYPWQKFGSLFFEDTYGKMMEQGLSNLKQLSETRAYPTKTGS
jgi:hypothetical protein